VFSYMRQKLSAGSSHGILRSMYVWAGCFLQPARHSASRRKTRYPLSNPSFKDRTHRLPARAGRHQLCQRLRPSGGQQAEAPMTGESPGMSRAASQCWYHLSPWWEERTTFGHKMLRILNLVRLRICAEADLRGSTGSCSLLVVDTSRNEAPTGRRVRRVV
jgi:hypothetical protein